jgi:phosphoribosylglycinamide formyltransferase-1
MVAILKAIQNNEISDISNVVVISNQENSLGLKKAKEDFNVNTEVISKKKFAGNDFDNKLLDIMERYNIYPNNGILCLAGFMQILSCNIVNRYKFRILNIHPSLLPSFRGLHAQKQALDSGVKVSGCTVHFVDTGIDTGPIIIQKCVPVMENDTEESLSERILKEEHVVYKEAINLFIKGKLEIENNKVFTKR